ncbi:hypothetical protein EEL32_09845 [Brevibacillus laterosporus]|uniref:Uncharacterized protein n=1 Tax=Brevibacillus laterosporus TaxID=1465 RepID=A0A502INI1_BRELA|nr:hypothetical protein [Brevibacillus laterosporus]QDX95464.1 hypothetical protein EEL30_26270 [Brevibacillus laterosporus]RAP23469.1 hypothetical protein C2W64_03085 [Brevibacillus laterosporus]TPG69379.1 hypothetical protein EEL31_13230 [Brevibacillus laterosporus]TPG88437.1 hypothetical protein EEL32_09845 [Brevibacillus laterosporus]
MLKLNTGCSFLHPLTGQMIHPGQSYQEHYTQPVPTELEDKNDEIDPVNEPTPEIVVSQEFLTLDQFDKLDAHKQKEVLVRNLIVSVEDADAVRNKEKRMELYKQFLEANTNDGTGEEAT